MASFPLLNLPPILLKSVIVKMPSTSYFHLQQTCRTMEQFIPTIKPIQIYLDYDLDLLWEQHANGQFHIRVKNLWSSKYEFIDVRSLYGVQVRLITPPSRIDHQFEEFCALLLKYRITAKILCMTGTYDDMELTREQCAVLFNILKPTEVTLDSQESDRFEALSQAKELTRIYIEIDAEQALSAVQKSLQQFQSVRIATVPPLSWNQATILDFLHSVLKFLRFTFLPNLRNFKLTVHDAPTFPIEETMARLASFNPTLMSKTRRRNTTRTYDYDLKCMLNSNEPCELIVDKMGTEIRYQSKGSIVK